MDLWKVSAVAAFGSFILLVVFLALHNKYTTSKNSTDPYWNKWATCAVISFGMLIVFTVFSFWKNKKGESFTGCDEEFL